MNAIYELLDKTIPQFFGKFSLRQSDERTNRYKTRDVNVTFEDMCSNAPSLAKIEFGNQGASSCTM